jgi:hypothetical protein
MLVCWLYLGAGLLADEIWGFYGGWDDDDDDDDADFILDFGAV